MNDTEKQARVELLAQRIELLFGFMAEMLPDIDLLEEAETTFGSRESFAVSAAPIFGALGEDFRKHEMEAKVRRRRAGALLQMLRVLRDMEADRNNFHAEKTAQQAAVNEFMKQFG